MSNRVTKANVENRVESLNRRMENAGSLYRYEANSRNGYCALDRYMRDPDCTLDLPDSVPGRGAGWICHSHILSGTKREVAEFLHAMMVAVDDANQKA